MRISRNSTSHDQFEVYDDNDVKIAIGHLEVQSVGDDISRPVPLVFVADWVSEDYKGAPPEWQKARPA